ncbi:MAG: hypothetical protein ACI4U2_05805, partial [Christensenellaceae bacterium]
MITEKRSHKFLSLALGLILTCSAMTGVALAQERSALFRGETIHAEAASVLSSGTCGDSLQWVLQDDGQLVVSGSGAMQSFPYGQAPWYAYRTSISSVTIEEGVT